MDKNEFNELLIKYPDRNFCLHNGFPGFGFGSPSNPKWISHDKAYKLLVRYEKLTGNNPVRNFDDLWYIYSLEFSKKAWLLRIITFYRMIGFYRHSDACYGDEGRG